MTRKASARSWTPSTSWPTIPARPAHSRTAPDLRRPRAGRYRVLHEITADAVAIRHIARHIED